MKPRIVILSGAGVSAESGIATFRDSGGLWEGYDVMEVASIQGWQRNKELVLDFYNQRRKNAISAKPNLAHEVISDLQSDFEVYVITQNVDNLHEQAGSNNVLHLHGELFKSRSTLDESLVYPIEGWKLKLGDLCEKGSQLRPHIVWFGESVPYFSEAVKVSKAQAFVVVGTSLQVYPAASLVDYVPQNACCFLVDPHIPQMEFTPNIEFIEEKATKGMAIVAKRLKELFL